MEARRAHERGVSSLVALLREKTEAQGDAKASLQKECAALMAGAEHACELSAARERDLAEPNAMLLAREHEPGSSLSTAVDSLNR